MHSLWMDGANLTPRAPLAGDTEADVAIVGVGYTGLWTAYYLRRLAPGLRVLVLEAEYAGFGASGRNGGWCSAELPASLSTLARRHGRAAALARSADQREQRTGRPAGLRGKIVAAAMS